MYKGICVIFNTTKYFLLNLVLKFYSKFSSKISNLIAVVHQWLANSTVKHYWVIHLMLAERPRSDDYLSS